MIVQRVAVRRPQPLNHRPCSLSLDVGDSCDRRYPTRSEIRRTRRNETGGCGAVDHEREQRKGFASEIWLHAETLILTTTSPWPYGCVGAWNFGFIKCWTSTVTSRPGRTKSPGDRRGSWVDLNGCRTRVGGIVVRGLGKVRRDGVDARVDRQRVRISSVAVGQRDSSQRAADAGG